GIGDIKGIIDKADYLKSLGINAVWLSPFYPSALADGGYDVDDYRDVDPRIGNLEQFDDLVTELHRRGIRIFVDIVPNHCSDRHIWFQAALKAGRGSKERERFIFREGRGANGELPPSDLASHFGPEGWTRVEDGQWYMHLFTKEQPDFNWDNPEVHEEFLKTLKFWSDRGVDGFRIDVAHALKKQLDPLPNRSSFALDVMKADGADPLFDRDEVHEIYADWRELFNQYDPPRVAVAEAWVHPHRRAAYASEKGLGQAFNFDLLASAFRAGDYQKIIDANLAFSKETGSSSTWVLSNHDVIRHATRMVIPGYGDAADGFTAENNWYVKHRLNHDLDLELGLKRAKAASLLILALPGSTYLYQGEELGLHDVLDIPSDQMQDPQWFRGEGKLKSRDGCRVPLPWEPRGSSFGFGSGGSHLPQPKWFSDVAVATQEVDPDSTLNLYRKALELREKLKTEEELVWLPSGPESLMFERPGGWICITNFGAEPVALPSGELLISSGEVLNGMLSGPATAWLKR
ncbi:MAG: alpha-amylase, partial [Actinobacteria bacterium]|nr:alpha-amylase [Actinomycetota bacterium]